MTMDPCRSYLDHNATAPIRPAVAQAMASALALPGNASSIHGEGRGARGAIERARDQVAALLGATAKTGTFTSGGTAAANTALTPTPRRIGDRAESSLLPTGSTAHACGLNGPRLPPATVE